MKAVVAVNYREMALLEDYSKKTGISIDRCVSDALFDWLADVAPMNLRSFGLPPLNAQLGRRGIKLVKSQKRGSIAPADNCSDFGGVPEPIRILTDPSR
jgi:hypothetical protein